MNEPIIIPLGWSKPPLTGNRTRGNPFARANEVKAAKAEAYAAIRRANVRRVVGAEVTLHFRPATRHRRDADGLAPTLKVVLDALVAAEILPDDSWVRRQPPRPVGFTHPPVSPPPSGWSSRCSPSLEKRHDDHRI